MSIFPEGEWPPSIGNRYIQLALIQYQERFPGEESTRVVSEGCLLGRIDRIIAQKKRIEVPEVFQPDSDEEGKQLPLRVLVDGAPGVGKTTLCLKVCKDWADQKLLVNYHLVVLLQLRQEEHDSVKSIRDIFFYPDPKLQDETISTIVQSGGEGVLVILDAFDELTHEQRRKSIFMKLIYGQLLPKCSVIVTSRPYASEQLQQLKCIQKHVEVLGFTDHQIQECIKQHVPDKQKGRKLAKLVEDRQDIALFCYIPLNCAILLFVYKMENYTLPDSLTQLFTLFIVNTLKRDAQLTHTLGDISSLDCLPSPMQDSFVSLCAIAYNGLLNGHLVFSVKTLKQFTTVKQTAGSQFLGLMTATKSFTSMGQNISYQFLHLTIQEFLAARYVIAQLSLEEQVTFLEHSISDDRFRVTAIFIAGLSQLNHSGYAEIFCCKKVVLPTEVKTEQDQSVIQWFLFLTHLLYESQNASICGTLASAFVEKTITLTGVELTLFNCMTLCYFLLRSCCKWRLNLGSCRLRDSAFEMFKSLSSDCPEQTGGVQALKLYTDRFFQGNSFSPLALLLIPQTPLFSVCHEIVLHQPAVVWTRGCDPPDSDYCLSNLLTMTHLTHLEIVDFRLLNQSVVFSNLTEALIHNKALKVLCLNNCGPIHEQAFQRISTALQSTSLKSVTLSNLGIRGAIAVGIFEALQRNKSLQSLDVGDNFELLSLETNNRALVNLITYTTTLQTLNLFHCGLADDCVKHLAVALEQNNSLKELDISHNRITAIGAICLFEVLQQNKCLEKLNLDGNELHSPRSLLRTLVNTIEMVLQTSQDLRTLDICCKSDLFLPLVLTLILEKPPLGVQELLVDGYTWTPSSPVVVSSCPTERIDLLTCTDYEKLYGFLLHVCSRKTPHHCCEHLRHLDFSHSQLAKEWNLWLCGLLKCLLAHSSVIESLNLSNCGLNYDCIQCISAGLKRNNSLQVLNISHNEIHSNFFGCMFGALKYLERWYFEHDSRALNKHPTILQTFNPHCGLIDDRVKYNTIGLELNNSLKEVDISHNRITAEGAICIFKSLQQNKCLEKVNLDGNYLHGDVETLLNTIVVMLQTNHRMKCLNLHGCPSITLPLLHTLSEKPPPGLQEFHVDGYTWTPSHPLVVSSCPTERIDLLTCTDYEKLYGFLLHVCARNTPHQCCEHLRYLDFSHSPLARGRNLWLCGLLSYLLIYSSVVESLNLSNCELDNDCVECISEVLKRNKSLRVLNISHNEITSEGVICLLEAMQWNKCLECLDISALNPSARLTDDFVKHLAKVFQQDNFMKELVVSHNSISAKGAICLFELLQQKRYMEKHDANGTLTTSLQLLNLSHCDLTNDCVKHLAVALEQNNSLKELDISHNEITYKGTICLLEALQQNKCLLRLNVSGLSLKGNGCTLMFLLKYTTTLQVLRLSYCGLTDKCVKYLHVGLGQNNSLKELDISHNSITAEGAIHIFESLQQNTCLLRLNVSGLLRGDSCTQMDFLRHTTTIQLLNLSHCGLADNCVKHLAVALEQNNSLKELDISHNRITAEGAICLLEALQQNKCLEKLNLNGNKVYDDVERLVNMTEMVLQTNRHFKSLNLHGCASITVPLLHTLSEKPPPGLQEFHVDGYTWTPSHPLVVSSCPIERIDLLTCTDYQQLHGFVLHVCARKTPHRCCKHLRYLDFSCIPLARERNLWLCGAVGYLLAHSSVIESLNFSNCGLDDGHVGLVASGMAQNSSLKFLDISHNKISACGAKIIVASLQRKSTLMSLDMSYNNIRSDSCYHDEMVKILKWNHCLKTLNMGSYLYSFAQHTCAQLYLDLIRNTECLEELVLPLLWKTPEYESKIHDIYGERCISNRHKCTVNFGIKRSVIISECM